MTVASQSPGSNCDAVADPAAREICHCAELHQADKKLIAALTAQRDDAFQKAEDKSPAWLSDEALFLLGVVAGATAAVGVWRLVR